MSIAPETVVAAPATTPPLHSLILSAVEVDEPNSDWERGFVFQPENCVEGVAWNPCGTPGEIDRITVEATGGTWSITFDGETTDPLSYDASAADVQTALEGLSNIEPGDVFVSSDGVSYFITWSGQYTGDDVSGLLSTTDIDLIGGVITETFPLFAAGEKVIKPDYDGVQTEVVYHPFVLVVPYTCSAFGFQRVDYSGRARRQLEANKSKMLEHEFWTGFTTPANPSLMNSTPNDDAHILNPGGAAAPVAVSPGIALMLIAQALSNCGSGGRGMIHGTPATIERWINLQAVSCTEKLITTCGRGDIIVNGTGYPGTGPFGQPPPAANQVWAYATGMVNVRLGESEVYPKEMAEAFDRRTNSVTYRGEVTASAVHDLCCSFAVLIDLCATV